MVNFIKDYNFFSTYVYTKMATNIEYLLLENENNIFLITLTKFWLCKKNSIFTIRINVNGSN